MSALDTQTLIDSLLRGVMISSVNRLVFKGGSLLSMAKASCSVLRLSHMISRSAQSSNKSYRV